MLVAGVLTSSYPDPAPEADDAARVEFEPQPFRFKVMLVKTEGDWLVDDFSPVSSEIIDPRTRQVRAQRPMHRLRRRPPHRPHVRPAADRQRSDQAADPTPTRQPTASPTRAAGR